ncbi:MAG: DHH family phosphoesterase, partial [Lentisphaerota bacterium]
MGKYIWKLADIPEIKIRELMTSLSCSRPLALFFAARGINHSSAELFFQTPLQGLGDPYIIPGMKESAKRLWDAVISKEKILIHGDYDTDGVTAAALLHWVLSENGADVSCFLPDRFDDGYGFTVESLSKALSETNYKLIVTVDCGISSYDAVDTAKSRNVDIIITDHHEPQGEVPAAFSVINPKVHPKLGSLHILSGAGVCFKLCQGFIEYGKKNKLGGGSFDIFDHLDIVSLGTVADIVPLVGENRILVKNGLNTLSKQSRPGIRALCEISGMNSSVIKTTDITFSLAPRLNAAGRLGDPYVAYKLLNSKSIIEAGSHSETLNNYNMERQNKEEIILNEAKKLIESSIDVTKRTII